MIFKKTAIEGAYKIILEKRGDERGFFARGYCEHEFKNQGIMFQIIQANIAYNPFRNTLRGLHYQIKPHGEKKLVRCVKGAIYDVIVDLRINSPSYMKWIGVELDAENRTMLYVPKGCAHGYQTLSDDSEIFYMVSAFYAPESERGINWSDPAFNIDWKKGGEMIISDKDKNWPEFTI
ncbi:MAG: dTDP-4-dehydrorhamnose 3,5-epimerase [Balneolales bacterium]